ncbi:MAG: cytochrome C oxidase subunit IV family protein [Melioribacteraceae bacterium]
MDNHSKNNHPGYSTYFFVWLALLAFTSITVTVAGINLGKYTMLVALGIAAVKSILVVNIFMHIKFEEKIFKVFIALSFSTLLIIFILTSFDIIYR